MASKVVAKLVKPPISLFGIEGRYVNALYSAASKSNQLDAVEGDLKKLAGYYNTDQKFKDYMVNPIINPVEKRQVFASDLKNKLKLNDLSVNLLSVMAENRRLNKLPDVQAAFGQIMSAVRNELQVTVKTATTLNDTKKKEVADSLKGFSSKKLLITYEVDPSMQGGLIVDFNGEHYIDMSVRSRFRVITEAIKQA